MIKVLSSVWALLLGIVLIMLGNGMHFTLIGLRGGIEGFSATELAIVTSGYFLGFLSGARLTPLMIQRVGHVRVFAALGSFMSAGLIALPLLTEPWAWTALRIIVGFCMSGIYVAAESWLNASATNETRGKVLSAYMIAQTLGIIGAQGLLTLGDAATSTLFIGASILVSISFAPILLSATPVPAVEVAQPMPLRRLFVGSPLGTVGIFLLGSVYANCAFHRNAVRWCTGAAISDWMAVRPDGPTNTHLRVSLARGCILCARVDHQWWVVAADGGRILCRWGHHATLCPARGIHERFRFSG
jgi:MFS family permease